MLGNIDVGCAVGRVPLRAVRVSAALDSELSSFSFRLRLYFFDFEDKADCCCWSGLCAAC